ncbi:EAL domain-containing protein [Acidovorax sp. SUPP950]|uniref:bifunctional diguanylate cyclase/phosphodiesterase n=1 Tax=unclassified Acidovorax TaxID=2684926 RepID=UPI0023CC5BAA|nr:MULTISPECIES: EAL domain-containing protein [unclassified Acidovorax]GKS74813.1 EAL domain-containing protein [Acidovorax sp. SUPP950]GKS86430.1 EAL domain-containing protein [Acidovorax sp. SUPP1855]
MRRWQISLRTAIAVPFAVLFAATVALHAFTQQRQIGHLIDQESVRLLDAVTLTARDRLSRFLSRPFEIQRDIADAIGRHGLYQPGDMRPIHEHLRAVFDALYRDERQISLLSFGSRDGEYTGMRREADGFRLILKDRSTEGLMHVYQSGTPDAVSASFRGYDPRIRPWYVPVARSGRAGWSPIYTTAGERADVTISAASAVIASGQMVGVMEADVRLDTLNQFLRDDPLRGNGHIFILDTEQRLVAQSEGGSVLSEQPAPRGGERERLTAGRSASAPIRAAAAALPHARSDAGIDFQFAHNGERYFARVTPFTQQPGIDWRIVVLLPESDLLGDTRVISRRSILAASGIALLGLLLGLWAVQRVARPILLTADAANRLSRGDWEPGLLPHTSALRETTTLIQAFNQMADRLRQSFQQMREQLLSDPLTRLLTRRGLLEKADWKSPRWAVLSLVGLDAFRAINDSVGFGTGDRLMQAIAERMRQHLPATVLMARLGGDEFALLHLDGHAVAEDTIGKAVLGLFSTPFSVGADEVMLNASVGVVAGSLAGEHLAEWLRNGSIALGEAKRRGRNQCVVFEPCMVEQSMERTRLAIELRQALEKGQFLVHYQPVIDLASGRVTGAEALVRWNSPTRGLVPPGTFIPIAEESDLILALGDWVLRAATQAIADQLPRLPEGFDIHVNVSARQLIQSDFPATLQQVLRDSRLPPDHLTLELTESVLIEDDGVTQARLAAIRALGVKIAIDDFGTGYSSLAYLSRLPFDCLKIDQRFVRNLLHSPQDAAIVTAVLHIAKGFGVAVVAEGVETEGEARQLRAMGCAQAQGYHFGRPAPLELLDLSPRE